MININGKEWHELSSEDIELFLSSPETEESFFFEFKKDEIGTKDIAEEISAFSNTYGGYIFIGVADNKEITGCSEWNEEKITNTLFDRITPTPSFDIKGFVCSNKLVYVIRIDEGAEPPYITSTGSIFERVSSTIRRVTDSAKLVQLFNKHEKQLEKIEKQITIDPLSKKDVNNVYGYIDIGFSLALSDRYSAIKIASEIDLKAIAGDEKEKAPFFNLHRVGNSFIYTPGGLTTATNKLPANLNNFVEIMCDGSAKMRVLLYNNNPNDTSVNMLVPFHFLNCFREFYSRIFNPLFPEKFIYAKKYESITVLQQFQPVFLYDPEMIKDDLFLAEQNDKYKAFIAEKRNKLGTDIMITNNRYPKNGLLTIDRAYFEKIGIKELNSTKIIEFLFNSMFVDDYYPFEDSL